MMNMSRESLASNFRTLLYMVIVSIACQPVAHAQEASTNADLDSTNQDTSTSTSTGCDIDQDCEVDAADSEVVVQTQEPLTVDSTLAIQAEQAELLDMSQYEIEESFLVSDANRIKVVPTVYDPDQNIAEYPVEGVDWLGHASWSFSGAGAFFIGAIEASEPYDPDDPDDPDSYSRVNVYHRDLSSWAASSTGQTESTQITKTETCFNDFREFVDDRGIDFSTNRCSYSGPIAVSEEGGRIAFVQKTNVTSPGENPLWAIVDVTAGEGRVNDFFDRELNDWTWSPNGKWLLVAYGPNLKAYSSSGKECPYENVVSGFNIDSVDWGAADNGQVVFSGGYNLWLVPLRQNVPLNRCPRLRKAQIVQLTDSGYWDTQPQWLTPRALIGFLSNRPNATGKDQIWVLSPDNPSVAPQLLTNAPFHMRNADWQPSTNTAEDIQRRQMIDEFRRKYVPPN